jgi:hypothetical protein
VRITSGFGGGEFTKTLRKVCTVLLVPITSRVYAIYKYIFLCAYTHLATKKEGVCRSPLIKIICIYSVSTIRFVMMSE